MSARPCARRKGSTAGRPWWAASTARAADRRAPDRGEAPPRRGLAIEVTRKRLVLVATILGTTVVTVDSTVTNVALPAIERDLGGGLAGQQWTSNAYLLTLGALLTPAALAVIVTTFSPEERGRAVGAWTAWGGVGTVLGPLVGGQLVDSASWRWIFMINLPIVVVTLLLILRVVAPGHPNRDAKVDVPGAALCAAGLGAGN